MEVHIGRLRLGPKSLAATAAVLVAAGGVLYASIPDSSGVFTGCYANKGGALRLIDASAQCKNTETRIAWNQTGPQGLQGEPGPSNAYFAADDSTTWTVPATGEPLTLHAFTVPESGSYVITFKALASLSIGGPQDTVKTGAFCQLYTDTGASSESLDFGSVTLQPPFDQHILSLHAAHDLTPSTPVSLACSTNLFQREWLLSNVHVTAVRLGAVTDVGPIQQLAP